MWRHGRTAWNAEKRFQGSSDVHLDAVGRRQAAVAAEALAQLAPTRIVSSDLQRAYDTALALRQRCAIEIDVDAALRETHAGTWEGKTRTEIEAQDPSALAAWGAGSDLRPGGGERRSEVAARMVEAIERALVPVGPGGVLVVVTHGGSARAAIGSLLGLSVDQWGILGVLSNCAWCVLSETGGPAVNIADLTAVSSDQFPDVPPTPPWRLVEYNAASLPTEALADDS